MKISTLLTETTAVVAILCIAGVLVAMGVVASECGGHYMHYYEEVDEEF